MTMETVSYKNLLAACALGSALLIQGCTSLSNVREEEETIEDLNRKGIPIAQADSPIIIDADTFGAVTPQGIAYHPKRKTLFVSANGTTNGGSQNDGGTVFELTTGGELINSFSTNDYAETPEGIAYDPQSDSLLIVDGFGKIFQVDADGTVLRPSPMVDLSESLSRDIDGIAVHPQTGNLWVTDDFYEFIYEIGRDGRLIQSVATDKLVNGFFEPEGLEFISSDTLLIADDLSGTSAIYEWSTSGKVLKMLDVSLDEFWDPEGVAFTGSMIAVVDGNGNRLMITPYLQ